MNWRVAAFLLAYNVAVLAVSVSAHRRLLLGDAARPIIQVRPSFKLLSDEQGREQKALLSLKTIFDPDIAAAKLANWKPGTYPCDGWQGVYCTSEKRVYFVDLAGQGLRGKLSEVVDLSALAYLQILWLQENRLAGSLHPSMFKGLGRLHELMLYDNELDGSLPAGLSEASQLKRVYLNGNRLSGSLPPEWSGMTYLTELGLASNQLEGTVPETYGNWGKLKAISIHNNPNLVGCLPAAWSAKQPPVRLLEDETHATDGGGLNPALVFTQLCGFCSETCSNPPPPVPSPSPQPPSPSPEPVTPSPSPEPSSNSSVPSPSPVPSAASNSSDVAGSSTEEKDAAAAAATATTAADGASNATAAANGTVGPVNGTNPDSTVVPPAVGDAAAGPLASPEALPTTAGGMSTFSPTSPKSKVDNPDDLVMADTRKSVFMSIESGSNGSSGIPRKRKKVLM